MNLGAALEQVKLVEFVYASSKWVCTCYLPVSYVMFMLLKFPSLELWSGWGRMGLVSTRIVSRGSLTGISDKAWIETSPRLGVGGEARCWCIFQYPESVWHLVPAMAWMGSAAQLPGSHSTQSTVCPSAPVATFFFFFLSLLLENSQQKSLFP